MIPLSLRLNVFIIHIALVSLSQIVTCTAIWAIHICATVHQLLTHYEELMDQAQDDIDNRWHLYEQMIHVERTAEFEDEEVDE